MYVLQRSACSFLPAAVLAGALRRWLGVAVLATNLVRSGRGGAELGAARMWARETACCCEQLGFEVRCRMAGMDVYLLS